MRSQGPHFLRGGDVRFGSWLCENSERAFTEGNRVLPAPRFPCCLATARDDIGAGEEGHSMRSACPSVLTRPRPIPDFRPQKFLLERPTIVRDAGGRRRA